MLRASRSGWRGAPALDVGALADLIIQVGQVMTGNTRIREIDLNPVIIHPVGEGVVALDALMLAEAAGITLIALARPDRFEAFTHTDRIHPDEAAHVA